MFRGCSVIFSLKTNSFIFLGIYVNGDVLKNSVSWLLAPNNPETSEKIPIAINIQRILYCEM